MGKAVALRLAAAGAAVAVNDLRASSLERTTAELSRFGNRHLAVVGDVTDATDVARAVATTVEAFGSVDIVVNNAGTLRPTRLLDISEEEWVSVVDVSVKGAFLTTQAAASHMIERGWGRIVNMSSTAGKSVSTIGGAHYTTAKAAVLGLTRASAKELASHGITVNAVCPGLIDTDMTRRTITPAEIDRYATSFPIPRLGSAEEVAELIAFIASDRAAYITGAAFDINGGDLMV